MIDTGLYASVHLSVMVVTDPSNPSVCDDCQLPICCLYISLWWVSLASLLPFYLTMLTVTDLSSDYPSVSDDCHLSICCLSICHWLIGCLSICQWWLSLIYLLSVHLPVMIVTGLSAAYLSVNDQSAAFPSVCDMSVANKGERAGDRPTGRLYPSPDSSRYCLATQLSYCSTEYLQT